MTGMTITNARRKKALMSHYAGEEVDDIIDTLVIPAPEGDADEYTVFRDVLTAYFLPQMNAEYAIYKFRTRGQEQGETLDMYVTELKKVAKFCDFPNLDHELKSQIIQNCRSTKLRNKRLRTETGHSDMSWIKAGLWNFRTARQGSSSEVIHQYTESKRTSTRVSRSSSHGKARVSDRRDNLNCVDGVVTLMVAILRVAPLTDGHVQSVANRTTSQNTAKRQPEVQNQGKYRQGGVGDNMQR